MNMQLWNWIEELMQKATCAGCVEDDKVVIAENQLGVQFPKDYSRFIKQWGAVVGEAFEIFGLIPDSSRQRDPLWTSVVEETLGVKNVKSGSIPDGYVLIAVDGFAHGFYLDTTNMTANRECPVVAFRPETGPNEVAASFAEFIKKYVEKELEYE